MNYWKSIVFVLGGASCYGILSTMVKTAYSQGFSPADVTGSQMFFGALILTLLVLITGRMEKISWKSGNCLTIAGMFVGLTGIFYYSALQLLPASIAVVLLFQFTWMGVLMEAIIEKRWPSRPKQWALVFISLGTVLAGNVLQAEFRLYPWQGMVLGLLAAFCYAVFILASGRLATEVSSWMRSLLMGVGSMLIVFMVFPPQFLVDGSLIEGLWLWGLLLAFFGIVLPNLLFTYGVPQIGSGVATILSSIELPMAVFLSYLVLQENVTLWQWLGVVVILMGIVIVEHFSKIEITGNEWDTSKKAKKR
ncbi:DMT family transporter [Ammoniphilus sp. YIM 78166]|uniref:EamA family transporter n=1 Tax=Ammoniphilus sp. YIM 78166 TaxID=1644106 RepID=UPI001F0ED587|nr:DMT family transporter [Ammoniphilus sp. YIM 78166]